MDDPDQNDLDELSYKELIPIGDSLFNGYLPLQVTSGPNRFMLFFEVLFSFHYHHHKHKNQQRMSTEAILLSS